jgi:hypothetical protein
VHPEYYIVTRLEGNVVVARINYKKQKVNQNYAIALEAKKKSHRGDKLGVVSVFSVAITCTVVNKER